MRGFKNEQDDCHEEVLSRKKLILRGLAGPCLMVACAILTGEYRLFANPMVFCAVLAVSLLIGAAITEFFSVEFMMTPALIVLAAGIYYFAWYFPWGRTYIIIFIGGLIGGTNLGLLSPKRFILK